ncbi:DMT family transporter [Alphaproteobacteria bacterium LSUCC0719]
MADDPSESHRLLSLGVTIAIAEILLTVGISALVKLVAPEIDTVTVLLFRYALCLPLLVVMALWQRRRQAFSVAAPRILAVRVAAGLASLTCFYAALDLMSLAKVTVLFQTITLCVTFLAPFMLQEPVGWRRWSAVIVGFGGTLILLEPGAAGWSLAGVLVGLGSPFFGAIMMIMLRRLGQHDSPATTAVWYNGTGAALFLALVLVWDASLPATPRDIMILVLIGVLSSFQQFFIAFSHKLAPASLLAPLRYLSIPFGIVAGILFFDEVLSVAVLVGSGVVVASSIFILRRERVRRDSARAG